MSGLCSFPGTLTVYPNAASNIVTNSHRGVYTDNSNIDISGTKMMSVVYGIYTKSCNLGLSANIVANTITSSAIAIDMIDNAGATTLLVNGNTINMTDQGFCTAVRASEISNSIAKYIISDNTINMKTMGWGIMAQKSKLCNYYRQHNKPSAKLSLLFTCQRNKYTYMRQHNSIVQRSTCNHKKCTQHTRLRNKPKHQRKLRLQ
ncbi:MAG: hypothetical protein IPP29_08120 [Bacteroidetes bacterium]|nr:hypothetical protein [Bacteroidota bacterium]